MWDWQRGITVSLPGPGSGAVLLAAAGDSVASLDRTGTVRIWRGEKLVHTLPGFRLTAALALSHDGTMIAAGRDDGAVRLVDVATRVEIGSAKFAHRSPVTVLAFSPDGKTLASGGGDREIHLWSTAALTPGPTLTGSAHAVSALAFAPNNRTLASGSVAGLVRLWDCRTGTYLASNIGHFDTVTALAFAPDGKTLASGSDDQTAKLWDAETGQERATLTGHTDHVTSVQFAADSSFLATVTSDGVVKVWRADRRVGCLPSVPIALVTKHCFVTPAGKAPLHGPALDGCAFEFRRASGRKPDVAAKCHWPRGISERRTTYSASVTSGHVGLTPRRSPRSAESGRHTPLPDS